METKNKPFAPAFIKAFSIFVALIIILGSCDLLKKEAKPLSPVIINTNPNDPLVASVSLKNQQITEFYGIKNNKGIVERIDRIVSREKQGVNEADYVNFDEKSRLKSIYLKGGGKFLLTWKTDSKAVVTYLTANGLNQASTELDFNEPDESMRVSFPNVMQNASIRSGMDMQLKQIASFPEQNTFTNLVSNTSQKELKVYVTQCGGLPADAEQVSVIMYRYPHNPGDKRIGEYIGKRIVKGMYSVILPSDVAFTVGINKQEACQTLTEKISGVACDKTAKKLRKILKWGKISIPSAIISSVIDDILESVCEEVANKSCENSFEDKESTIYTGQLSFLATVIPTSGSNSIYFPEKIIDGNSLNYPDLKAEIGGEAKANTLILNPDRPTKAQSYKATASISCLPVNTLVTISVIGTDGYKNAKTLVVKNIDENGYFNIELIVPGAATGVKDEINLKATLPNGNVIIRNASLVFQ